MTKKRVLRIGAMGMILVALAIMINLSNRIMDPLVRLSTLGFWALIIPVVALLLGYAFLVTYFYYLLVPTKTVSRHVCPPVVIYSIITMAVLVFMHYSFVWAIAVLTDKTTAIGRYWMRDFPYIGLPLIVYILLVWRFPTCRMYRKEKKISNSVSVEPGTYPDWRSYRNIHLLQIALIEKLGYRRTIPWDDIRIYDILLITSARNHHFVYLVNGEKIAVGFNTSHVLGWKLKDWFYMTKSGTVVNMIHIHYPIDNKRQLRVQEQLIQVLGEKLGADAIDDLLVVSRYFADKKLTNFVDKMYTLPDQGWEEKIKV